MKLTNELMLSNNGFVFDASIGESFLSNPVGLDIIKLLQENKELDEIKKELALIYDAEEIEIDRDVDDFIGMLQRFNLIQE